ncbi:iron chelate uptake ABC transporter family permease subunit [Clostridium sp. cel8]|jgi:iron complex transport system permease protein|uniref:FecCD family ABC transporter permease n=1 Tax=unclassified Clostridium TaxID=2614128 RepID=UPI0015F4B695|nr:iron chelate uptake ABC transporter family permease subunit [Clostridium sp. cel8]MBA5851057.1 iron chelate uptake ABC transporter family permease subunit [Clostridium sp. cel8]
MDLAYRKKYLRFMFYIGLILLFFIMILSATFGIANISFTESLRIILSKIYFINNFIPISSIPENHILIILKIRLPRIVLSALVGMGLSIVGASFQSIFKNPMADPYILGISSGAALGASLGFVFKLENSSLSSAAIMIAAFIGSILSTILVYNIARVKNKIPTTTLLLAGISVNFLLSSLISIIMVFNRDEVEQIVFWTMGSFSTANFNEIILLIPFLVIGITTLLCFSKDLNIIITGDETAKNLGVEVEKVKKIVLVVSSMIVAACVSVSGIIGFVGLIIPHVVRIILGPNNRVLMPFSLVFGAGFMIISDTLARTIASPAEIPVGSITALFGAPYFIYLLIKSKKKVM